MLEVFAVCFRNACILDHDCRHWSIPSNEYHFLPINERIRRIELFRIEESIAGRRCHFRIEEKYTALAYAQHTLLDFVFTEVAEVLQHECRQRILVARIIDAA